MSEPGSSTPGGVGASRAPQGSSSFTTVSPAYELRQLKVAYGIQNHPGESMLYSTPAQYLSENLRLSDDLEKVSDSEYINHLQGVRFTIEETTDKQQFITWLKTPEVHVIYMGHARYGRGPCFGAGEQDGELVKTEDWEQGTSASSGIFRMGFPYIGVEASESIEHGYTANPVKESEGRPAAADCDPTMRGYLSSLRARTPEQIHRELAGQLRNHQDGDRYWSYHSPRGMAIVHHAGWRDTLSSPSELGALQDPDDPDNTQMKCRVFTHLGCSTFDHNYPVVRRIANWKRSGNERYAYWTTSVSRSNSLGPLVHGLISYNRWNAFESWEPSLKWALQKTNSTLRNIGESYRLI